MKPISSNFSRTEWMVVISLVILKLGINFYFNIVCGLHRDEYLYLAFSDHMAWGYASVPPFMGVISWLVNLIGCDCNFWIRFFPTLAGAISVFLIARMVKEMGGRIYALLAACLAFIFSPIFLRVNSFLQPVAFDQLAWLLSMYFILKLVLTNNTKIWYIIFIIWGIGFLNKYLIAVLILASLSALLISRYRRLLFSRDFIFGGIIALVIISPNILWQYHHHFPVIFHMNELRQTQLVNVIPVDFLMDQVVMNIPTLILLIAALTASLFIASYSRFRFLAVTYLFILLILVVTHGKNYYTLGIYPILFALGGYVTEKGFTGSWSFMKYVNLAMITLSPLPYIPVTAMPFLGNEKIASYSKTLHFDVALRWEDGKIHAIPQDFADMTGWNELYGIVRKKYMGLSPEEQKETIIYAANYGRAGSIKYYGKKDGIPEPICFVDSFLLWAPDSLKPFKVMIYVEEDTSDIRDFFDEIVLAGRVNDPYFRENGMPVYVCKGPSQGFYQLYGRRAREEKDKFN